MNKKDEPNGCGPAWFPDIIPDGPPDPNSDEGLFLTPCNEHDDLYLLGGGWKEKHYADFRLFRRSCLAVKRSYKTIQGKLLGYLWALVYLFFTLTLGFTSFNFHNSKLNIIKRRFKK